ncbi:MAG: acyl carrier protein [Planctomycetes bacterium]|nr:acyl carrier protein [Planctomycetota bacterium]
MSMPDAQRLKAFVVKRLSSLPTWDAQRLPDDGLKLVGAGLLDSLGFLELMTDVEQEFGLQCDFSSSEPEVFTTLGGFVAQFSKA